MGFDAGDNAMHAVGGAALVTPMVLWPSFITTFFVFFIWGLLREQAQFHVRGATFEHNWFGFWSKHKAIEALSWGVGAAFCHIMIDVLR